MGYQVDFTRQYNLSYITRYNKMRELIMSNPTVKDLNLPIKNLTEDISIPCVVIAILFVDSKSKKSILNKKNTNISSVLEGGKFYIEDAQGKIMLLFTESFEKLKVFSSGMILGFIGSKNERNEFICSDVIFPIPITPVSIDNPISTEGKTNNFNYLHSTIQPSDLENHKKVVFMSNITINDNNYEISKMVIDFCLGFANEIVIFGNVFTSDDKIPNFEDFNELFSNVKIKVKLIPGLNDPTTKMIPMEPFHKMLFKKNIIDSLDLLSQPTLSNIFERGFVLMNDYIIQDLLKYTKTECTTLDVMEQLIKIRYLAPNSPDTISSVPFLEDDPLIINNCDYFVVGGSAEFSYKKYNGISLVTVPDFIKTQSVVVLDLETNDFDEVTFTLDN